MKRLIKILRSRFFLAAFCIVLEFVQLLVVYLLLYEFFVPVTVMGWIFYIGVYCKLEYAEQRVDSL